MKTVVISYFCDKCGKEIPNDYIPVLVTERVDRETGDYLAEEPTSFHVCADCMKKVTNFITQKGSAPRKRTDFDIGKAQALRDAGWTYKAISEEMKCSEQTIWNKLNKKAGDKDAEDEA